MLARCKRQEGSDGELRVSGGRKMGGNASCDILPLHA